MSCEYVKVTDKFGRIRLEDLQTADTISVQNGDIVFINELTSKVEIEVEDEENIRIRFPEGTEIVLEGMVSLLEGNDNFFIART